MSEIIVYDTEDNSWQNSEVARLFFDKMSVAACECDDQDEDTTIEIELEPAPQEDIEVPLGFVAAELQIDHIVNELNKIAMEAPNHKTAYAIERAAGEIKSLLGY